MPGADVHAGTITVPPSLNPATAGMLAGAVRRAQDDGARVLVLRGEDGVFCRGLDFASLLAAGGNAGEAGVEPFVDCIRSIREATVPTVAVVDGETLGGGVGIAAACDVVIAGSHATFGLPEVLFGLLPAAVMPFLLERMPPQKARLLALTGRGWNAAEGLELGLVDVMAPGGQLDGSVRSWVRELSRCRPGAAPRLRAWAAEARMLAWEEALDRGAQMTAAALRDPDLLGRIRRFQDGEELPWENP